MTLSVDGGDPGFWWAGDPESCGGFGASCGVILGVDCESGGACSVVFYFSQGGAEGVTKN